MKIRYNVIVQSSSRGVRKQTFAFNKQPHKPGSIAEALDDAVEKQYAHLGFGLRSNKLPKYQVNGVRWKGAGVDDTDIIWMWCPEMRSIVCIKAERVMI